MFKKLTTIFFLAVAAFTLASCVREEIPHDLAAEPQAKVTATESLLTLSFEEPGVNPDTKSVISAADFDNAVKSVLVYLVDPDGHWKKAYSASGSSGLADKKFTILADGSTYYDIYALVNMGEADFTPASPQNWVYTLPESFSSLSSTGLPMCGSARIKASEIVAGGTTSKTLTLRRLMSKVNITVNKSGMLTGASDGSALAGGSLKLRQVSKVLRPFADEADRRAQSASEMYSADTDWHNFTGGSGKDVIDSGVTLYIPENRQGTGSGTTQSGKTPASGREALVTYLEYTATKSGSSDGVSGNLTYKAYLGENELSDFNVIGDKVYTATLSLSWNGMWEGSWRVSQGDWADTRALVISAAANSATAMASTNTKAGSQKVRKASPTAFYMNFFPGGTSGSVAHGRKDLSSWPYGWVAYVDGKSTDMTGTSGYIKNTSNQNLIAWSYDSATDCLSMEAVAGAPANTDIHTLQFWTLDGRKSSNVVYFTTSIPFEFRWEADTAPNHVAQRGILYAIDPDTGNPSSEAIIKLKDANSSQVRLTDNGDGTAVVELIDGFSSIADAIRIADSDDDRECLVPLEGRVPWFECSALEPATNYIDDQSVMLFTYLQAASDGTKTSTKMKVVNNGVGDNVTAACTGNNLDLKLVNELIAPEMSSTAGRLSFDRNPVDVSSSDGSLTIFTHVHTYEGVAALIAAANGGKAKSLDIDSGKIFIKGHASDRDQHSFTFTSWNPWYLWYNGNTTVKHFGVMNDYSLYHEPANWMGDKAKTGWESNPSYRPVDSNSYSDEIPNVVIKDMGNLKLNAAFAENNSYYVGYKVATGTPSNVSWKFEPSSSTRYELRMRITNKSNYDWRSLGDYAFYVLHHIPVVWISPDATDEERKNRLETDFVNNFHTSPGYFSVSGMAYESEDDAWQSVTLPAGVSKANPTALQGVEFYVVSVTKNINSTWTLTCSMKGLGDGDITTHSAGKVNVVMQVINPYNSDSPMLEMLVADSYVRLHLYVWPAAIGVTGASQWGSASGNGWAFKTIPYCYIDTNVKSIPGLETFWGKEVLIPTSEVHTKTITAGLTNTYSAAVGQISRSLSSSSLVSYQFHKNGMFDNMSDSAQKDALMTELKGHEVSMPFRFREPAGGSLTVKWWDGEERNENRDYDGLNSVLGGTAYYYRASDYTLYYDPSGSQNKYSYGTNEEKETTGKLFVIHLGDSRFTRCYYFDESLGFRDQN